MRTTYRVTWEMDVEADSPEEAATKAQNYQRNPEAVVGYFEITAPDGARYGVDLDEAPGEAAPLAH